MQCSKVFLDAQASIAPTPVSPSSVTLSNFHSVQRLWALTKCRDDIVVVDMVTDMVADMKVDIVADMEADMVADMEVVTVFSRLAHFLIFATLLCK